MACAAPPFELGNPRRVTRECRKNRERRWMAFFLLRHRDRRFPFVIWKNDTRDVGHGQV
jgi:hypothetical protein